MKPLYLGLQEVVWVGLGGQTSASALALRGRSLRPISASLGPNWGWMRPTLAATGLRDLVGAFMVVPEGFRVREPQAGYPHETRKRLKNARSGI